MSEEMSETDALAVPIEWQIPEDLTPRYATNFVIQNTGHEFVLSFFEVRPPIILGNPEEKRAQLEKLGSVSAKCIAQIVLSPTRMAEFVRLLHMHHERQTLELPSDSDEE